MTLVAMFWSMARVAQTWLDYGWCRTVKTPIFSKFYCFQINFIAQTTAVYSNKFWPNYCSDIVCTISINQGKLLRFPTNFGTVRNLINLGS